MKLTRKLYSRLHALTRNQLADYIAHCRSQANYNIHDTRLTIGDYRLTIGHIGDTVDDQAN